MSLPKRFLVPTDFGERSNYALDYAVDLARKLGATITVLHAYEVPVLGLPDGALGVSVASRIAGAAQQALNDCVRRVEASGVAVEGIIKSEGPWSAIMNVLEGSSIDLVVMGTHGRRGLPHALLGSVTEKVVRTANCPVLTIRAPETKRNR